MKSKTDNGGFFRNCAMLATQIMNRRTQSENSAQESNTGNIIGTPAINAMEMDGAQAYGDTCAIKAQELILERYTNREISEHDLVEYAHSQGWYIPGGGTPMPYVGNLLEQAGIPVSRREGGTLFDLYKELAEGKQIIIGVDGAELRGDDPIASFITEFCQGERADHAVVVSGINTRTNEVIITDPATGFTEEYSFSQLTEAWSDSNFFMMSTSIPAPKWVPGMDDFNYATGHISSIDGIPYDTFNQTYSHLTVDPAYTSDFGLSSFLEAVPHSYGAELSTWSLQSNYVFPSNWESLCVSDHEWLAEVTMSTEALAHLSDSTADGGFWDIACEIFENLS